ncbi:hypothetical protein JCM8547_005938 [Rhodosporidiobolus lusitaniae]
MARRRKQLLDDGDSSGDSALSDNDNDDPSLNDDERDELSLFRNSNRGKKRTREQRQEDATYGVWAQEQDDDKGGGRGVGSNSAKRTAGRAAGGKKDYLSGQAFVAAGSKPSSSLSKQDDEQPIDNLAPTLAIEAPKEDEEDVAMEMGSSDDDDEESQEADDAQHLQEDEEQDEEPEEEVDQSDLAPVPGLARPKSPTPPPPPAPEPARADPGVSLAFAPRGLGAGRGRGGSGSSSRGGLGSGGRAGLGSGGGAGGAPRTFPAFTSSSSTLSTVPSSSTSTDAPTPAPTFALSSSSSTPTLPSSMPPPPAPSSFPHSENPSGASTPHTGLGASSSRPGLGGGAGGIDARPEASLVNALRKELAGPAPERRDETVTEALTAGDGREEKPPVRRTFLPTPSSSSTPSGTSASAPKAKLSASESRHFAQLSASGSIGMKLLEKMGWQAGTGLGKERQGIVTPVGEGQKLRRKGEGIREGERSKGALEEEKRRRGGEVDLGDSATSSAALLEAKEAKKKAHQAAWQGGAGGRKAKEKRPKVVHKTYEEILAEQGQDGEGMGMGQTELLVDLNGQALTSQSLSASLPTSLHSLPAHDTSRLPELRHNLTLLTSTLSSSLRSLAREGTGIAQRRKYLEREEQRVREKVEEQGRKVQRLEAVVEVCKEVKRVEEEVGELLRVLEMEGGGVSAEDVLGKFEEPFKRLEGEFGKEYEELGLDEVVVAALTPTLRRLWTTWDPLTSPSFLVPTLKRFRKLFRIDSSLNASALVGAGASADPYEEEERLAQLRRQERERAMTPYESLMWGVWVPKIRSAINNSWHPHSPYPAVTLYTTWLPLLPSFLRDNLLSQLILPKVLLSIADWSPSAAKRGDCPALHQVVFPWLEVAGGEGSGLMEEAMEEARRKVRGWVKSAWKPKEGVPKDLAVWKDAFPRSEWDSLLLRHVLPALGAYLRTNLVINPRQQDLEPLEKGVLEWRGLLRSKMVSQVLEQEFFPKWGEALWRWLVAEPSFEQVAEWYSWWKSYFPEDVVALSGVSRGFRKGLDLMNQAMVLGEDAKYRLKKPDFTPKHGPSSSSSSSTPSGTPRALASSSSRRPAAPTPDAPTDLDSISFRSVVEDVASSSNLVFLPTGKSTSKGQQLFRVSKGIEGRGGVTVYLEEDVVWVASGSGGRAEFEPVGVEEMVRRALGGKG